MCVWVTLGWCMCVQRCIQGPFTKLFRKKLSNILFKILEKGSFTSFKHRFMFRLMVLFRAQDILFWSTLKCTKLLSALWHEIVLGLFYKNTYRLRRCQSHKVFSLERVYLCVTIICEMGVLWLPAGLTADMKQMWDLCTFQSPSNYAHTPLCTSLRCVLKNTMVAAEVSVHLWSSVKTTTR